MASRHAPTGAHQSENATSAGPPGARGEGAMGPRERAGHVQWDRGCHGIRDGIGNAVGLAPRWDRGCHGVRNAVGSGPRWDRARGGIYDGIGAVMGSPARFPIPNRLPSLSSSGNWDTIPEQLCT